MNKEHCEECGEVVRDMYDEVDGVYIHDGYWCDNCDGWATTINDFNINNKKQYD